MKQLYPTELSCLSVTRRDVSHAFGIKENIRAKDIAKNNNMACLLLFLIRNHLCNKIDYAYTVELLLHN